MKKTSTKGPYTKYDDFMRVFMGKIEENENLLIQRPSTKYDHFVIVSIEKVKKMKKFQQRDHT